MFTTDLKTGKTITKPLRSFRSVGWTFTSFLDTPPVLDPKMRCMIYQREICKTGREHWQGAFRMKTRSGVTFKTAQKIAPPGAHLEASRGTWRENVVYCSKQYNSDGTQARKDLGTEPTIIGDAPMHTVEHLDQIGQMIRMGVPVREIADENFDLWARNHNAINRYALMQVVPVPRDFSIVDYHEPGLDLKKSVILIGPTNIGKTCWALSHFLNPLLVRHTEDLKRLHPDHDGIVFDDMEFSHWPRTAQIHILDMDFPTSINVKNGSICIPKGMPRIFTGNERMFTRDEAIDRRVNEVIKTSIETCPSDCWHRKPIPEVVTEVVTDVVGGVVVLPPPM